MPTRSRDWNEEIAMELKNPAYAQTFLLSLLEEGDDLQTALGRLIRLYGVKEYAKLVNMDEPAIQRAINPEHNPTKQTFEKILAPIGLDLGVKPKLAI
jgi:DNA-binding phage protein